MPLQGRSSLVPIRAERGQVPSQVTESRYLVWCDVPGQAMGTDEGAVVSYGPVLGAGPAEGARCRGHVSYFLRSSRSIRP